MAEEFVRGTGKRIVNLGGEVISTAGRIATGAVSGVERMVTSEETHQAIEKGKRIIHGGIRKAGEVLQSGRRAAVKVSGGVSTFAGRVGDTIEGAKDGIEGAYDRFEQACYTDGKMDGRKVEEILSNKSQAVANYGVRALKFLARETKKGAGAVVDKYREMAPTRQEIEAYRKDGIGVGDHGILFKPELQRCKIYRDKARRLLDYRMAERDTILEDIGANIIGSKKELQTYYKEQGKTDLYNKVKKNL